MSTNPPNTTPTAVDICNLALSKLGESPLSDVNPNGSLPSRLCYMHYHPVRREVLCANRWTFATKHTTLTAASDTIDEQHALPHTLPLDCLRVLEVNHRKWMLQGRAVFCPAAKIHLTYIADVEDTSLFDPLFIDALATRLAYKMCIPLINSTTAKQALQEEYQRVALPHAAHFHSVQSFSNDTNPLYALWLRSKKESSNFE